MLYGRRAQMCVGRAQKGNGFEFWRHSLENEGTSAEITQEGWKLFNEYGKCNKFADLARHLDGWKQMLDDDCPELYTVPSQLYTIIVGLIPDKIEEEITTRHDDVLTFEAVIAFCKKRTSRLRNKALANLKRRTGKPISSTIGNVDDDEDDPNRPATRD